MSDTPNAIRHLSGLHLCFCEIGEDHAPLEELLAIVSDVADQSAGPMPYKLVARAQAALAKPR